MALGLGSMEFTCWQSLEGTPTTLLPKYFCVVGFKIRSSIIHEGAVLFVCDWKMISVVETSLLLSCMQVEII